MESICFPLYVQWTENGQTCLVALRIWSSVVIFLVAKNTFHFGFFFFLLANNFYTTFFRPLLAQFGIILQNVKKSCLCWTKQREPFFCKIQLHTLKGHLETTNHSVQCKALSILYKTNSSKLKRLLKIFFQCWSHYFSVCFADTLMSGMTR